MEHDEDACESTGLSRRTMIAGTAGFASALAAAITAPGMATADAPAASVDPSACAPVHVADPATDIPEDTVIACIRHAERGEITIITGETERTFHEPALAKRLLELAEAG
ncbi:MAG: hypothetical protein AAGC46_02975 [Solirubrobacteraceae bacterium]|nr:hypothetical protein [Patulibacter sp.]